jgi:hypothetical protein
MNTKLLCSTCAGLICLGLICITSGCQTSKVIDGVPATDLSGLYVGISRIDTEKITGEAIREFQCGSGTIVTYLYDRGWIGCGGDAGCQSGGEAEEIVRETPADNYFFGIHYDFISRSCIDPCQKGHLEVFFNQQDRMIGVRELPTEKDVYCWGRGNKRHRGYPCDWINDHPRPSSVPKSLILYIDPEDIPDKICDQFNR